MNNCLLCEKCVFEEKSADVWHEIHITVKTDDEGLEHFSSLCTLMGGKTITIELGDRKKEYQTMSSITMKGTVSDAKKKASTLSKLVSGFAEVERIKLECSVFHEVEEVENGYYEGHLAVKIPLDQVATLEHLAKTHSAHTAKNAFKEGIRMVTLRSSASKADFTSAMDQLEKDVSTLWSVSKRIQEYCYYDSNKSLDDNWINRLV